MVNGITHSNQGIGKLIELLRDKSLVGSGVVE